MVMLLASFSCSVHLLKGCGLAYYTHGISTLTTLSSPHLYASAEGGTTLV